MLGGAVYNRSWLLPSTRIEQQVRCILAVIHDFRLYIKATIIMKYIFSNISHAVLLALVFVAFNVRAMDIEANFDGRLYGASASVFFHSKDEMHATRILKIFNEAKQLVAKRLPNSNSKVKVYLYGSSDEMAQGVKTILRYNPMEIKAVIKVGITEQRNNTLHLHPKTAKWGSRLTHAIVDEHIHGVLQEKYGTGPSTSAIWIEEGLTSYLAHEVLAGKLVDYEDAYPERRFKVAFKALVLGKLPKLDEVSTRSQWYSNINESHESWNNQYALAYFSVSHLVSNYGFESVLDVLSDVAKGLSYKDSMENVTGTAFDDFEHTMRVSLLYTGIFHLYIKYTVFILAILTFTVLISIYLIRWVRQTSRTKSET